MLIDAKTKRLPGPRSFYGIQNLRGLGQKGMLDFIAQQWQQYKNSFETFVSHSSLLGAEKADIPFPSLKSEFIYLY